MFFTLVKMISILKEIEAGNIPFFFGCKPEFFSFQNNPKNLDPSYQTGLDLWDSLGRVKFVLEQNFSGLI